MEKEKSIRLERKPEARTFTVERLLLAVKDGKIRVPDFQRPLRWRSSHVLDFFDSIYKGFPVGTLLLARRPAEAAKLSFGPVWVDAPAMSDALFVVDGQQRVTALAAAILHPDARPRGGTFAVWFDLENERFARLEAATPPPTWIPLNIAGNRRATSKWVTEWPLRGERPDLVERVFGVNDALEQYEIQTYIAERASEEALRTIYKRVNTSGVEMKESEVFDAIYGRLESYPVKSAVARLQEETAFGEMDPDWFLRCLKSVEGLDPRRTFREIEGRGVGMEAAVQRTEDALRRALLFLVEDAAIPHASLLPYRLPLLVLGKFFHFHPDPHPRARRLLVHWVWRGALSGAHAGTSHAEIDQLQRCVDTDAFASIDKLLALTPDEFEIDSSADLTWNGRAAVTRLYVLALLHRGPRDPMTGEVLGRKDIQALLARRDLRSVAVDMASGSGYDLARRVVVADKSHVKLLPDASDLVRESHLIDEKAAKAARKRDWAAFTKSRGRALDAWAFVFFDAQSGLDDSDRPTIAEIVRRVDVMAASA